MSSIAFCIRRLQERLLALAHAAAAVVVVLTIGTHAESQQEIPLSWYAGPDQVLEDDDEGADAVNLPLIVPPQSPDTSSTEPTKVTAGDNGDASETSNDERLKTLEEELAKLKDELEKGGDDNEKEQEKYPGDPTAKFTMELQADAYTFGQDAANVATVGNIPNGTAFRRARVGWVGEWELTEYRIEFDFAQSGRPSFLDVWAGLQEVPVVRNARVGHYFEPFSLERMTSNRFNTFLERSLLDSFFVPARNTGFGFSTYSDDERLTASLGLFAENSDNFGDDVGFNRGEALTGRITSLPYWRDDGQHYVHLGAAASFRNPDDDEVRHATQPEARLGAASPNVPFFVDTGTFDAEQELRGGLELAWIYGPFSVQSEYMCASTDRIGDPDVFFDGVYLQTSWFLTGEHRPYLRTAYGGGAIGRVIPHYNACIASRSGSHGCGWGAWEVATRVSYLDGNDEEILGRRLTDVTFGLNWYLTPYLRVMSNYIHAFLDDPTIGESDADILGARVQYDF